MTKLNIDNLEITETRWSAKQNWSEKIHNVLSFGIYKQLSLTSTLCEFIHKKRNKYISVSQNLTVHQLFGRAKTIHNPQKYIVGETL